MQSCSPVRWLSLPPDLLRLNVLSFLEFKQLAKLDSALCQAEARHQYLLCIANHPVHILSYECLTLAQINWLISRGAALERYDADQEILAYTQEQHRALFRTLRHLSWSHVMSEQTFSAVADALSTHSLTQLSIDDLAIHFDGTYIESLLSQHRNLISIDLCGYHEENTTILNRTLVAIANYCPKLTTLSMLCESILYNDEAIKMLLSQCKFLRTLSLEGSRVEDSTLVLISQHCPLLVSITANECVNVTGSGFTAVVRGCSHLKSINFSIDTTNPHPVLETFTHHCGNLTRFELLSDVVHMEALPFFAHVQQLTFLFARLDSELVAKASCYWRKMQRLSLFACKLNDSAVRAVAEHCMELMYLD